MKKKEEKKDMFEAVKQKKIILKHHFQVRNKATSVRVELKSYNQGRRKNEVFVLLITLPLTGPARGSFRGISYPGSGL